MTGSRFDLVFDCLDVFKVMMNALANPGKTGGLKAAPGKLETPEYNHLLAAALTLLDNTVTFAVCGNGALAEEIRERTHSVPAALDSADYVFITESAAEALNPADLLNTVKTGTLSEPQKSASLFIAVPELSGDVQLSLSGHGVDGERTVPVCETLARWLAASRKMRFEFPTGVDIFAVSTDGKMIGIPRKTQIQIKQCQKGCE
jgi:alpha-D-ribose 1-methylphosphonate 5-triphosphate synthase subunit PhnH